MVEVQGRKIINNMQIETSSGTIYVYRRCKRLKERYKW